MHCWLSNRAGVPFVLFVGKHISGHELYRLVWRNVKKYINTFVDGKPPPAPTLTDDSESDSESTITLCYKLILKAPKKKCKKTSITSTRGGIKEMYAITRFIKHDFQVSILFEVRACQWPCLR